MAQTAQYIRNSGKPWTPKEIKEVKAMAGRNTPTRVIGLLLGRSTNSVYAKASENSISLRPTNQRPYNRNSK